MIYERDKDRKLWNIDTQMYAVPEGDSYRIVWPNGQSILVKKESNNGALITAFIALTAALSSDVVKPILDGDSLAPAEERSEGAGEQSAQRVEAEALKRVEK